MKEEERDALIKNTSCTRCGFSGRVNKEGECRNCIEGQTEEGMLEQSNNGSRPLVSIIETGWPPEATMLLIETFRLHRHEFLNTTLKKFKIWRDIAKDMEQKGYAVDGAACDTKMRSLKRRYKTIKESASLSERDGFKQWPYFNAMDELMAGDHALTTVIVDTGFPASTAGIQRSLSTNPSTIVLEPSLSSPPSPAPSGYSMFSPLYLPVESLSPLEDSVLYSPQGKGSKKRRAVESPSTEAIHSHRKLQENLISANKESNLTRRRFTHSLQRHVSTTSEISRTEQQKLKLQNKIDELHHRLLQLQEEHHRESKAVQLQHIEEIRELQQDHKAEIRELHQQFKEEMKELYQQHQQLQQQHQEELRQQQELFYRMQQQHQEQLLKLMTQRIQQN